jgi:hypothetical protein
MSEKQGSGHVTSARAGPAPGSQAAGCANMVAMITQAERAAERRKLRLEEIERQVKDGSLTIRKMTAEERRRFPVRPAAGGSGGRRRR